MTRARDRTSSLGAFLEGLGSAMRVVARMVTRSVAPFVTLGVAPIVTLGVAVSVALSGCRSADPAFFDSQERPLEELPPVMYSVAVAPVDLGGLDLAGGEDAALRFAMGADELQAELVAALTRLNAASAVYAVGPDALAAARARRADLLVRPRLRSTPALTHVGISDRGVLATVFWFTTWIGSFWVADSTYDATMSIDFDVVNPYEGVRIDSFSASSDAVDLTFWDRNEFVSWGTLESVIIPPFWTHDHKERTSRALSEVASSRLAARLVRYLKEDLATTERDFLGEVRLQSPKNGAVVGEVAALKGKVIANMAITSLAVYLNDSDVAEFEASEATLPAVAEQRVGNAYQVFIERDVHLRPGKNLVAIEVGISGRLTSRTLVVHSGVEDSGAVAGAASDEPPAER